MKKPMPYKLIEVINYNYLFVSQQSEAIILDNFFGFLDCIVISPPFNSIKIPILPTKYNGETIFPTGSWRGTYFSEELKEALKHGYKFKLITGYKYSKIDLFSDYIDHFYQLKKTNIGIKRFIAKMHLNQLYGYFGRKQTLIGTININKSDLRKILMTKVVKTIVKITDDIYTILIYFNLNPDFLKSLNATVDMELQTEYKLVFSNVSIASAVTSYAPI